MANELARAELEKAIERASKRRAAAQLRLNAMAEEADKEKKLIASISKEMDELIASLDSLGGPVEKQEPAKEE